MTDLSYQPVEGKTYSLFGESRGTTDYYDLIRSLADGILIEADILTVIETIQRHSSHKRSLRKILDRQEDDSLISYCLQLINPQLKPYTKATKEHLAKLPFIRFRDRRLATSEEQYHLYMLEIELTNRMNLPRFLSADRKISLQPYCLQDFSVDCKATSDDFDYQCKGCSKACYQNAASSVMRKNHVEPYIWMGASVKDLIKESQKNQQSLGIFGIACIPELVMGMRKYTKYHVPAIGLPLNANRCVRWFGEFHSNSIDLSELERFFKV